MDGILEKPVKIKNLLAILGSFFQADSFFDTHSSGQAPVSGVSADLSARIRRTLRHYTPPFSRPSRGPRAVQIDSSRRVVFVEGREIDLTPNELKILGLLADRQGAFVPSEEIARNLDYEQTGAEALQAVRVNIRRLRRKMEADPVCPQYILNKWGAGYSLKA
ncbi:winged helix-turn-helix domain-containing protein [Marispirochaeta sp.]|jgi:DNA-binding response OmpR family regulator|uniref:winged helix-turn-helix domain-containing protein n=1 Tax=Marispirochaeta sp. TaxID=2038653 RepID=UPI0029C8A9DC|nr:winged helix-turn-helix domain-containing protein [Marispirochaeta sp.]